MSVIWGDVAIAAAVAVAVAADYWLTYGLNTVGC